MSGDSNALPCGACGFDSVASTECPGCLGIRCYKAGEGAGYEAGRLAAVRAEVMWAMRDMEDEARSRSERHPDDAAAGHVEHAAWERLADCRRWLEAAS